MATKRNRPIIQTSHAAEILSMCFEKFNTRKKKMSIDEIEKFGKYLSLLEVIDSGVFKQTKQKYVNDKAQFLKFIRSSIKRQNYASCDCVLSWMGQNGMDAEMREIEIADRQRSFENLVRIESKNAPNCDILLKEYAKTHGFLKGTELDDPNCMYHAIHRVLNSLPVEFRSRLPHDVKSLSISELREKLTTGYLFDNNVSHHVYKVENIDRKASSDWRGFVWQLKQKGTQGHPFVLHAAAMKYKMIVHVVSMADKEEFVLYPEKKPVRDGQYPHVYLAHLQKQHYISLAKRKDSTDELQTQVDVLTNELANLKQRLRQAEEDKFNVQDEQRDVVLQREEIISQLMEVNKKKDEAIREKDEMIRQLKEVVNKKDDIIREKDEMIKRLNSEIKEWKRKVAELREHILNKEERIQELQNQISQLQDEVDDLQRAREEDKPKLEELWRHYNQEQTTNGDRASQVAINVEGSMTSLRDKLSNSPHPEPESGFVTTRSETNKGFDIRVRHRNNSRKTSSIPHDSDSGFVSFPNDGEER